MVAESRNSKAVGGYVDVRSLKDVPILEKIIKGGPIVVVLIYADWCGHCTRFKEDVWSKLLKRKHRASLASIHHDQLENTILKDAKIRGYPSVLVVGKDGKPAVFKGPDGEEPTNAMPNADMETLERVVDADAETILSGENEAGDPTASIMTPPDARDDMINRQHGGGGLLRFLKRVSAAKSRTRRVTKRRRGTRR